MCFFDSYARKLFTNGDKMNYHIVSEGVETQEEMEQISSWGVEMIQGYYFSKPLPEKELLELLKKQDNIER